MFEQMWKSNREIDISEIDNRKTDEEWLMILQGKVRECSPVIVESGNYQLMKSHKH